MNTSIKRIAMAVFAGMVVLLVGQPLMGFVGDSDEWPKGIRANGKQVVMHQPQPERLVGDLLTSRVAVSVETKEDEAPVFGVVWLETRLHISADGKEATVSDVRITNVRFPGLNEEDAGELQRVLERNVPQWALQVDMATLQEALDLEKQREEATARISTQPPKILFTSTPAVLVVIDGEPRLKQIDDSELMRVVNTPFTIIFSPSAKRYYLFAAEDTWFSSQNMYDDWAITRQVPGEVVALAPKEEIPEEEKDSQAKVALQDPPPSIIISTEPAELISTDGEPEYTPVKGTDLLYITNTASDVLLNIVDRQYYVLLAGRWYASKNIQGPWDYVTGEDLPPDFRNIPEGSDMARVLYAVPGTQQARNAVMDAHVPTTVAVDRKTTSLTVEFDGKPEFEPITGTNLYYAVNTAIPVIWTGTYYYACNEGVWFVAPSPKGPWQVATSVPASIYTIPPDSPVYHVTYVRVYNTGPEVVYVGYTPGYTHTYVYNDTIVYGTGYYWPGWYGRYYYPRPRTWGFHAHWDPWYGWGYGLNYGTGSFRFSIGFGGTWYRGSWWGPYWYDYPYYYDGYWYGPYYRYGYYGKRYPYWKKRNKAVEIARPKTPGTRPGPSKGITRPTPYYHKDKYYKNRQPKQPYKGHPGGGYGRPKDKWLQKDYKSEPPAAKQPSRTAPPPTSQPKQQYNPKWGTQQIDPSPPVRNTTPRQGPPPSRNHEPSSSGPSYNPRFHGTMTPGGGSGGAPGGGTPERYR